MIRVAFHRCFSTKTTLALSKVDPLPYRQHLCFSTRIFSGRQSSTPSKINVTQKKNFDQRSMLEHRLTRFFATSTLGDQMKTTKSHTPQTKSYTGVEAEFYDLLKGTAPDEEVNFYSHLLQKKGGTALELGCGTGRLLFPLIKKGLHIQGLESSQDMLEICRRKASAQNVDLTLYPFQMQSFQISEQYESIFIEGGTFMLITDRNEALATLRNILRHLKPGGQAIIELFLPIEDIKRKNSAWNFNKSAVRKEDEALVFCSSNSKCDVIEQLKTGWTKYEVFRNGSLIQSQIITAQLRWYSKYEFWMMLEKVGFSDIDMVNIKMRTGVDEDSTMIFRANKL